MAIAVTPGLPHPVEPGRDVPLPAPSPSQLETLWQPGRGRVRRIVPLLGPAFVAAIAYVDPGNFATNITGGAQFGYRLLWVIVAANVMAMLVQNLSAKIGLATDRNLPELCRAHFRRPVTWLLWVQAEIVAMATDLAEVVGAAIALNLLFGMPLLEAGLVTAVVAFAILGLHRRGYRQFELAVAGMLGVILAGFLYTALRAGFDVAASARGLVPGFAGSDSVLLAAGILGATVMPHVVYVHSALTQDRIRPANDDERRVLLRWCRIDVAIAMGLAGLVNMSMLVVAASAFHDAGGPVVESLDDAHRGFGDVLGPSVAVVFALALLASGFASSSVGTFAGQVVMQGFIGRTIPLSVRRLLTIAPALTILAAGVDPTQALVLSQVVLSFGIPFALIPLVLLTRRRDVMGPFANSRVTTAAAIVVASLVVALNVVLLATFVRG